MPTWPTDLPQYPLVSGFSIQPKQNVISFGTEVGPGKIRRRSTARIVSMPFSMYLNADQLQTFIAFFNDDLEDGALPFTLSDPVTYGLASFRVAPGDPPYTAAAIDNGQTWLVTMQMQRLP